MKTSRREFIRTSGIMAGSILFTPSAHALIGSLSRPIKIGLIADLHQDIMHDGEKRLDAFLKEMQVVNPEAIIQLGDFAYPNEKNRSLIDKFNKGNKNALHVIGNHDTDSGHTKQQCYDIWGMTNRFYSRDISGLKVIVLDCNDKGSPTHTGGYPLFIGKEQMEWLEEELKQSDCPIMLASHQSLAGPYSINNTKDVQELLSKYAEKIVISVNGHSHIDLLQKLGGVSYFQVNSASYQWVGGDHRHKSYPDEVHEKFPWIEYTCPYRKPLFTTLTIDPASRSVAIQGMENTWVGPSPAELGVDWNGEVTNGKEIVPYIRKRNIL